MADELNNKKGIDPQKPTGGGMKFSPMTLLAWAAIITAVAACFMVKNRYATPENEIQQSEFLQKFDSNLVANATIYLNQQSLPLTEISGNYFGVDKEGKVTADKIPFVVHNAWITSEMVNNLTRSSKIKVSAPNAQLWSAILTFAPFVILGVLFWFFFIRQIKMAGKGALSFGKSKAKMLAKDRNKTTFKDVAGVDEAIEEVSELVEFLKDPKKFQSLGGSI